MTDERKKVVEVSKKMSEAGLTVGTTGNVSACHRGSKLVAVSPSGTSYQDMTEQDVVIVDFHGQVIEGHLKPTSETPMHLAVYRAREDVGGIVHTHSVFASTLACLDMEIPAVHYMVAFSGHKVPLAEYGTFGTEELAIKTVEGLGNYNAVLLSHHGLLAAGSHVEEAYKVAEQVEFVAEVYWRSLLVGEPSILSSKQMASVDKSIGLYKK